MMVVVMVVILMVMVVMISQYYDHCLTQISEEEIERIFHEIDKDESGSITKKEAVRACRRSPSSQQRNHSSS